MTVTTFMPVVYGNATPAEARHLFDLITAHPGQKRARCHWHDVLARVAQARSESMGKNGWFGHVDPDGIGPNKRIRESGIILPDWYDKSDAGNNTESVSAGQTNAEDALSAWLNSESHRVHVLGIGFYNDQTQVGVGYCFVQGSHFGHYWTLLSCPVVSAGD